MKNDEILEITKKFHDTYEELSKEFCYETREDTKVFDINSSNGKLMYATVNEAVGPILKENKQLKEHLLAAQTNAETFRLEMAEITQTLGLDEDTIFDDVKAYVRSLKDNWNKLKEYCADSLYFYDGYQREDLETDISIQGVLNKMAELERGVSDAED